MALLQKETINIIANKPLSSCHPWAAELLTGLDGCRALARLLGRVRETAARPTSCYFFLSWILAIFSQLFYAADITRQWVYELKIKRALLKLLFFCSLLIFFQSCRAVKSGTPRHLLMLSRRLRKAAKLECPLVCLPQPFAITPAKIVCLAEKGAE